jgi:glycerol uptake facilitator-like aquaporin
LRKLAAEFIGTFLLLNAIVGSGFMATNLTTDVGVQLLINALSTIAMLSVVISVFAKISGAHFNPAVSLYSAIRGKLKPEELFGYVIAQILGAISGTMTANLMFQHKVLEISSNDRSSAGTFIGEVVATFGLLLVIATRDENASILVPAWIGSAYFFTASTSFANPAVTIGRMFTDSFSGIAPQSIFAFIAAQLLAILLSRIISRIFAEERV